MKTIYEVDPLIHVKNYHEIIKQPVSIRVNEFNDDAAKKFSEQMSEAHNTGQKVIPIIIDSYGGHVYSLLAMIAEIQNAKLPVATIVAGKAMSCGSVLLSCGTEGHRYADENACIMIHDVSSWNFGKNEELKANAKETDRLQKQVFGLMAKNCGQDKDFFLKKLHEKGHVEWYLTASDAKKVKLINHIKIPHFKINLKVDHEFI